MSKLIVIQPDELERMIASAVGHAVNQVFESHSEAVQRLQESAYSMKDVLNTAEIAAYMDVKHTTVLHYINNDKLPASKIGRQYYARRADLDKWLAQKADSNLSSKSSASKDRK